MRVNFVDGEGNHDIHYKISVEEETSKKKVNNMQPGEALLTSIRRGQYQQK